jgi:hypothetical protein
MNAPRVNLVCCQWRTCGKDTTGVGRNVFFWTVGLCVAQIPYMTIDDPRQLNHNVVGGSRQSGGHQ